MNAILNNEHSQSLMNVIANQQIIEHQEKMNLIVSEQDYLICKTFSLIPFKDGNRWCVLLGKNIQDGISGFGETPMQAIRDFNRNFQFETIQTPTP